MAKVALHNLTAGILPLPHPFHIMLQPRKGVTVTVTINQLSEAKLSPAIAKLEKAGMLGWGPLDSEAEHVLGRPKTSPPPVPTAPVEPPAALEVAAPVEEAPTPEPAPIGLKELAPSPPPAPAEEAPLEPEPAAAVEPALEPEPEAPVDNASAVAEGEAAEEETGEPAVVDVGTTDGADAAKPAKKKKAKAKKPKFE